LGPETSPEGTEGEQTPFGAIVNLISVFFYWRIFTNYFDLKSMISTNRKKIHGKERQISKKKNFQIARF
jgi:hypothetical protein